VTAKTQTVIPELTDEWVAENSEDVGLEATNAEEFRKALKEYLEDYNSSSLSSDKFTYALDTIISNSEIKDYPSKEEESLIDVYTSNIKTSYETYATYYSSSGIDSWEDYISSAYGCASDDEFTEYAREQVHAYMDEKMVITLIAVENNLTVSADEIIALGEEWATEYGYDDYQEILDTYGNEMNAEVGFEVLTEKVQDFVNASVKVVAE
jgi:trigger factor